jgi:glycerate kinase
MAQALGVRFLRADGTAITAPMTGGLWAEVDRLDLTGLNPALRHCQIEVACDVDNPLLGPSGCAAVYGPQKGASAEIVDRLEANLRRGADLVEAAIGERIRDRPGAGAAGGLGAGLVAFLGARLRPGIELVLEASGLDRHLQGADLVLTGEGRLDAQTAHGKTISGVARQAQRWGVPVVAIVGSLGGGLEALYSLGLTSAFPLVPGPLSLAEAMAQGPALVADTTERVLRLLVAGQTRQWGTAIVRPSGPIP